MLTQNPCVFVVGCPRSGTTLLQRMLDAHPDLTVANDTHFITQALPATVAATNPPLTADIVDAVRKYRRFPRLALTDPDVDSASGAATTFADFVSRLYDRRAEQAGKRWAGEKTPDYVRHIPVLHTLFPEARFVHIIRDGRDVALSAVPWESRNGKGPARFELWADDPVGVCALWWSNNVLTGRRDGVVLGDGQYLEVRYEDLVAEPADTLRVVTGFLGLPFAQKMVGFHEGKTIQHPGLSAKSAWLPATAGLRDWRSEMPDRDRSLFEALSNGLLAELGYDLRSREIAPDVAVAALRLRTWWPTRRRRSATDAVR